MFARIGKAGRSGVLLTPWAWAQQDDIAETPEADSDAILVSPLALVKTASSVGWVRRPVWVFCGLGSGVYTSLMEVAGMTTHKPRRVWSVGDAQANLVELLRLSETDGPQYIDAGKTFAVALVVSEDGEDRDEPEMTLGEWLVENAPRGTNLVIPDDEYSDDEIPWTEESDE